MGEGVVFHICCEHVEITCPKKLDAMVYKHCTMLLRGIALETALHMHADVVEKLLHR